MAVSDSVFLIAEAGINHNGDVDKALEMVEVAATSGADAIKFQTFTADALVTENASLVDYQKGTGTAKSQHALLRDLELSRETHKILAAEAHRHGLVFLSTAFDLRSLEMLDSFNVPFLKVPSGEVTNFPYLQEVGRRGRPIFLSTGMSTLQEVTTAIAVLCDTGLARQDITVLHCTSCYPTDYRFVHLRAMVTLRDALNVKVGYSDHTLGHEVAAAAVALGASALEKHFTLDRDLPGPDHQASADPGQLSAYVAAVRNVERALGSETKTPQPCEEQARKLVRKSIVTSRPIRAGETLTPHNLTTKRPGTGISPMTWNEILGQTAARDFDEDEILET